MHKLKQRVRDVVSYKKNIGVVQTKIQVLVEMVAQAQSLLISEENEDRDEVQQWLAKADEILKKEDGIWEGSNSMTEKKRLCSTCWDPTSSWETGDILRDIDRILKEREGLDLSSLIFGPPYCKTLQSRENKLEDILEAVVGIHINMIGIYGMFGVGKTVLAEELARRAQNIQLFDAIVMVQVYESLDVKLIQTQIANKIGLQLSEADDEETRAHILGNKLDEKVMESGQENNIEPIQQSKILVILDGINHVIDLRRVGISHEQEEKSRCKVVVISRNADVCKEMGAEKNFLLECLNLEEAKILFRERLGDKIKSMDVTLESQRYQYVENAMLLKCRGLPKMVNSLACALRSMSWSNWEIVADEMEMYTLLEVDEVKEVPCAILELCNNFIQSGETQKRFLLCCLIQQGTDVSVDSLKRYMMGFGFFKHDSLAYPMNRFNSWVRELKSLSLLLEGKDPQHVKMHDIVKEVAISALSQGDYSSQILLDIGACWHERESYENSIAIFVMPDGNYKCLNGLDLNKLEAFVLKGKTSLSFKENYFQGMQNLKILDISAAGSVEFPSSIGGLVNLVTLHLEYCDIKKEGVNWIGNLTKLEVLSFRGSSVTLPKETGNLTNLRMLDLTHCKNVGRFCVDALATLVQLRELYLYDIDFDLKPTDMKKLQLLSLEVLEFKIQGQEYQFYPLALDYSDLQRFRVCIDDRSEDRSLEDFNSFSRVMLIRNVGRLQLQEIWLRELITRSEFLQLINVSGVCGSLDDLKMHEFLHLKKMYVGEFHGLKYFSNESVSPVNLRDKFPNLESLTLDSMWNLTSICWPQPYHTFFRKLRELRLNDLPQLDPYGLPIGVAVKLRVLEVSKCTSLLYVFRAADSSAELPRMEKLVLVDLPKLALASLQDMSPSPLLFNGKIKLPSLKEMHLKNLDEIDNLWDLPMSHKLLQQSHSAMRGISFCFRNVKYMTVSNCNKLGSMFSPRIANSLLQLEKLEVDFCGNMKEVITSDIVEDDANPTTMITFPKLHTLRLKSLRSLQCFYRGPLLLKFPMLTELDLCALRDMKAFTLPNTRSPQTEGSSTVLFNGEIDFPILEHLRVSLMDIELIKRDGDTTTFPNLSRLALHELQNLKSLPEINSRTLRFLDLQSIKCFKVLFSSIRPSMSLITSLELEELKLSGCECLEELVDDENAVGNRNQFGVKLFSSLKKLELCHLNQLKNIPWDWLTNLRSLIIEELKGWTSLMPTTLLVGGTLLPLLEYIEVAGCESLEAIIGWEIKEDGNFIKYGVTVFPCLRHMKLVKLPKLVSLKHGIYEAHFPSLETVKISKCPYFQSFSLENFVTPRLKSVEWDADVMQPNPEGKLSITAGLPKDGDKATSLKTPGLADDDNQVEAELLEIYEPGVFLYLVTLGDGTRDLKRVRFSRRKFSEHQAETWWAENRGKVYERYNICAPDNLSTTGQIAHRTGETSLPSLQTKSSNMSDVFSGTGKPAEWIEQYEPGVYITLSILPGGTRDLKRVRFSRRRFNEKQAETWWAENRVKVYARYNVPMAGNSSITGQTTPKSKETTRWPSFSEVETETWWSTDSPGRGFLSLDDTTSVSSMDDYFWDWEWDRSIGGGISPPDAYAETRQPKSFEHESTGLNLPYKEQAGSNTIKKIQHLDL